MSATPTSGEVETLRFHEVYDAGENRGRLAFTLCPGQKRAGAGTARWRNLRSDLKLIESKGYNVVLNLLPEAEMKALHMSYHEYEVQCRDCGLDIKHFPMHVHTAPKIEILDEICKFLQACYEGPQHVLIHSRGGLGRASLVAACALYHLGKVENADQALKALHTRISTYCVERGDQERALSEFCQSHVPTHRSGIVELTPPDLTRDSDDNPIRVNWMWDRKCEKTDDAEGHARLKGGCIGVTICPGKKQAKAFCDFKHFRNLKKDLDVLRNNGVDTIICLLSEEELTALQVIESSIQEYDRLCQMQTLELVHRPLAATSTATKEDVFEGDDPKNPRDLTKENVREIAQEVIQRIIDGECVVIHCRGGLKRAAIVAAAALKLCGKVATTKEAVSLLRQRRSLHAIKDSDVYLLP